MATYAELNARPASDFLEPSNFRTSFDGLESNVARADARYRDGLKTGAGCTEVGVSANGTWYGKGRDGGSITSYEGIGYHANTEAFWRGILESGCRVVVYRSNGGRFVIREAREPQAASA